MSKQTELVGLTNPSQLLTSIKTVDGGGSLLDADLLDGQQGSFYQNGIIIREYVGAAANHSTTSNVWVDTGLTLTITPASANSYFYVELFHINHINTQTPNFGGATRVLGGNDEIARGGEFVILNQTATGNYNGDLQAYGSFYNPAIASPIVFKTQSVSQNTSAVESYYWHWGGHNYINNQVSSPRLRVTEFKQGL
jgi:hypothetical protein